MDDLASQVAHSFSTGPTHSLRIELAQLFAGFESLCIQLKLPYSRDAVALTPNYLCNSLSWSLSLCESDGSTNPLGVVLPSTNLLRQNTIDTEDISSERIATIHQSHDMTISAPIFSQNSPPCLIGSVISVLKPMEPDNTNKVDLDANRVALNNLAQSLSNHSAALEDFSLSISSALFPFNHTPIESPLIRSDAEHEEEDSMEENLDSAGVDTDDSESSDIDTAIEEYENSSRFFVNSSRNRFPSSARRNRSEMAQHQMNNNEIPTPHQPLSLWLYFKNPSMETAFYEWYSMQMWKFDAIAMFMCMLFHTVILFSKGTSFGLYYKIPWTHWIIGYSHIVLLGISSVPQGRKWYYKNRDTALSFLLICMLFYHHSVIQNYYYGLGPALFRHCSGIAYSYIWLPFVALLFQARFIVLSLIIGLLTAVNMSLLFEMCTTCQEPVPLRRCIGRNGSKIAVIVFAALCVVYCIEWRARRLWLGSARRRAGSVVGRAS